ncbi:ABC-type glycine betaine transport, permease [Leifsonia xyli subsp. cynodontis DSM 46306]|uniref:ABC transmembrane type-1 domain-containing protein n=1 Tax=Leifsonia xyli subsp. cynodontis DSM 46306 TaxID=1389489 RepID=U3P5C7_LEIXC|nr:ABC transporter permease subunit [Leifsonia xyli]AGW41515.1 ABC-type glycine betaine transport, permease [Leifsonia xyli subsp. cynodontis DSM 46306]
MSFLWPNLGQVWNLALSHVWLSAVPIAAGFLLSLPIGWVANRYRLSRPVLLTIGGLLYAIPSLPLFFAMPALIGTKILSPLNVVVALSVYAVALTVRTTADALASVSGDVVQSAMAVGFSAWRRFWSVELPLAGPVLLAGLRVVSVSTVSLVSVGALLGVPNLGQLFTDGLNRSYNDEVLVGIVAIMVVALVFDVVLVLLGRLLLPWSRFDRRSGRLGRSSAMKAVAGA